eukprot:TRINITY_DN7278_c0_g1_i1.p1 TRINITY_DN7278_c0_g1~~TRINITY_DN7278_c0_g1_i1.p1  ORF type:complete len:504 (+),score=87.07 TRINITY_DN7278_c0_g1_i1:32-1543(+)
MLQWCLLFSFVSLIRGSPVAFTASDWQHIIGFEGPRLKTRTPLEVTSPLYQPCLQHLDEFLPGVAVGQVLSVQENDFKLQMRRLTEFIEFPRSWKKEYVITFVGKEGEKDREVFRVTCEVDPRDDYFLFAKSSFSFPDYLKYFEHESELLAEFLKELETSENSVKEHAVENAKIFSFESMADATELRTAQRVPHNSESTDSTGTLKVLSYNVWNFNENYQERMEKVVKRIKENSPDVVCLQEVRITDWQYPTFYKKQGSQLQDLTEKLPEYQFVFREGMTYFDHRQRLELYTQEGVAILSRFPIVRSDYIALSRNFTDRVDEHQRVCLGVVVATPNGLVSFFTTHSSLSDTARQRNIVEIVDFMKRFPEPHVLTGDLNSNPGTPEFQFLQGKFELGGFNVAYNDAYEVFKRQDNEDESEFQKRLVDDGWTYTTLSNSPKKRIDFIYYSAGESEPVTNFGLGSQERVHKLSVVDAWVGEEVEKSKEVTPASDHRPLFAIFDISN